MLQRIRELFFKNKGTKRTVFKNFFWLSSGQVFGRLLRMAVTIYAARMLGVAGYGVFAYVLGIAGFFTFFKNIGVDSILTREVARNPKEKEIFFATAMGIELFLLLITGILVIFVAPLFSRVYEAKALFPLTAVMIIFDDVRDFFIAFLRGMEKMEWEAIIVFITNVLIVLLGFLALFYATTPFMLMLAYTASSIFGTLVAGAVVMRGGQSWNIFKKFNKSLVAPIMRSAWPIAAAGLASVFLFNVDIVMLGWWKSVEDVGIYSATQKIIGIFPVIASIVGVSTFPVFSRLAGANDGEGMKKVMENTISSLFLIAVPLVVGGIILQKAIPTLIFGAGYISGSLPFAVLLLSILATFPIVIVSNFFLAHNRLNEIIWYAVFVAIGNIILNALLIPHYGMLGAAIATVFVFFVYNGLMVWRAKKINNFSFFSGIQKILLAAVIMGGATVVFRNFGLNTLVNIIVSGGLYFVVLGIIKEKIINDFFRMFISSQKETGDGGI